MTVNSTPVDVLESQESQPLVDKKPVSAWRRVSVGLVVAALVLAVGALYTQAAARRETVAFDAITTPSAGYTQLPGTNPVVGGISVARSVDWRIGGNEAGVGRLLIGDGQAPFPSVPTPHGYPTVQVYRTGTNPSHQTAISWSPHGSNNLGPYVPSEVVGLSWRGGADLRFLWTVSNGEASDYSVGIAEVGASTDIRFGDKCFSAIWSPEGKVALCRRTGKDSESTKIEIFGGQNLDRLDQEIQYPWGELPGAASFCLMDWKNIATDTPRLVVGLRGWLVMLDPTDPTYAFESFDLGVLYQEAEIHNFVSFSPGDGELLATGIVSPKLGFKVLVHRRNLRSPAPRYKYDEIALLKPPSGYEPTSIAFSPDFHRPGFSSVFSVAYSRTGQPSAIIKYEYDGSGRVRQRGETLTVGCNSPIQDMSYEGGSGPRLAVALCGEVRVYPWN